MWIWWNEKNNNNNVNIKWKQPCACLLAVLIPHLADQLSCSAVNLWNQNRQYGWKDTSNANKNEVEKNEFKTFLAPTCTIVPTTCTHFYLLHWHTYTHTVYTLCYIFGLSFFIIPTSYSNCACRYCCAYFNPVDHSQRWARNFFSRAFLSTVHHYDYE